MSSVETTCIAADGPTEVGLPEGWTLSSLGKSVDILDSRRVPVNSDERAKRHGRIPYYGATGQVGWIDDSLFNEELLLLGEDGAPFLDKSLPISYIISGRSWVNNHAHVLRAVEGLTTNHYLKFWLDAFDFSEYVTGSTRLKLTQTAMTRIPVSLPPVHEQYRVVKQVQDLLGHVSVACDHLSRVSAILKRLRQAVLSAACSGRLTEDLQKKPAIQALDSKSDLFDEDLPQVAESWRWVRLGDIGKVKGGKRLPKGQSLVPEDTGYPYIRAGNLKCGTVTGEILFLTPAIQRKIAHYTVKSGDVYVTIVGACIGDAGTIPNQFDGANLTENAAKITELEAVHSSYLAIVLRSPFLQDRILDRIHSASQGKLALHRIAALPIPVPPLEEQEEIIRRVQALFGLADRIERHVSAATVRADKLTQSILAKAFRGELVPTEAELARREGREYEPASVLLERITRHRANDGSTKSKRHS